MSQHPIDQLFQQGLGKQKAAVPESLWENIAADQARKAAKARNFKVAMFSAGSLVLALLLGLVFWPVEDTSNTPLTNDVATSESSVSPAKETTPDATTPVTETQTTKEKLTTAQNTNAGADRNSIASVDLSNLNSSVNRKNTTTARTTTDLSTTSEVQPSVPANSTTETASNSNVADATKLPAIFSAANVTEIAGIPTLPLPLLAPYERPLPQVSVAESSIIRKRKKVIEVDILGGFAYAHQILSADSEDNRSALNAREISEFPGLSYLAGIRVSYHLNDRISLRSGLNYGQIRNQFEYDQNVNVGTDSMQTLLIRSNNRLRLLEVPLLVGYELPGKRFRLAINAGPILNLSTKAGGRYLLPNQQSPVLLEENNIYRNNIGLSWQGSLTAAYDLGGGNSLLIEPTFKSYPRSFTTSAYPLKERYWMAGLQIGLRHKL